MTGIATFYATVLDCPRPRELAEFYAQLIGGEIVDDRDDWVTIRDGNGVRLAFQRAPDHRPPTWPEGERPQQFHIDVVVGDLDAAEKAVLALGATKHDHQPGTSFRVFLDPAGHPFCLCED